MEGYALDRAIPLSLIQSERFAVHAKENDGATWEQVSIHFPSTLNLILTRDREKGDDTIRITYKNDPYDPFEVRRALIAIQRQFVPLNRAEAIERALGPEMAEFYRLREDNLSRLERLADKIVKENTRLSNET